jgi:DNA-entry nuclease
MKTKSTALLSLLLVLVLLLVGCDLGGAPVETTAPVTTAPVTTAPAVNYEPVTLADGTVIPAYSGAPYAVVYGGIPTFTAAEIAAAVASYERFTPHDALGRCGVAEASIGSDLMPTEDRESIGSVKPSGWHTVKYDIVSGKYLYNRCHLIGFQLTGENANEENLITGTRYMNWDGMVPFEDMVADFVKDCDGDGKEFEAEDSIHVLYRATPVFLGNELVARGVLLEALSVEDDGEGISFCVFVYNVQPGVGIRYSDGESWLASNPPVTAPPTTTTPPTTDEPSAPAEPVLVYIVNTNTMTFHLETCSSVNSMKPENRDTYECTRSFLLELEFDPCGRCKP